MAVSGSAFSQSNERSQIGHKCCLCGDRLFLGTLGREEALLNGVCVYFKVPAQTCPTLQEARALVVFTLVFFATITCAPSLMFHVVVNVVYNFLNSLVLNMLLPLPLHRI